MAEPSGIGPRTRRTVMAGAGAAGLAAALSACGTKEKERGPDLNPGQDGSSPSQSGEPSGTASGTSGGGAELGKVSDVPVGGGLIDREAKVVVTQPTEGDFKAFSAVCTHQGCTVTSVEDGAIVCPCHKSKFAVADGKVISGPAPRPLPSADITVTDGTIRLA